MSWPPAAEDLLSAPRGRRLCWALLIALPGDRADSAWRLHYDVWRGAYQDNLAALVPEVSALVSESDVGLVARLEDDLPLLASLVDVVDDAAYWQPLGPVDLALADPAVRDSLLPLAYAVATAPAAAWWSAPVPPGCQRYVEWAGQDGSSAVLSGAAGALARWRAGIEDSIGGGWWSTPRLSLLPSTTRAIAGLGALGLCLVEDGFGGEEARCWPVEATRQARVCEITEPWQWADLAAAYPLDVTRARGREWAYLSDWDGTWLIPDFEAAASDYDAIHLSVAGYLHTAGRILAVDGARTILAGWNPDETYWLTDILAISGPAQTWKLVENEDLSWHHAESLDPRGVPGCSPTRGVAS